MINFGHGPAPEIEDLSDGPVDGAGGVIEPGDQQGPSLTPKQIADFAATFVTDATSYYYTTWQECVNLVSGSWRSGTAATVKIPPTTGVNQFLRPRDINVNIVQPLFRNVVSRLSVEQPSFVCVPATASTEDIISAQASEQVLRYFWRQAKVKDVLTQMIEWLAMLGTAALYTEVIGTGDATTVRVKAIAPDRLRAEPGVSDPADSRFLGITILTTKDALKRQFPDKAEAIDAAQAPMLPFGASTSMFGTKAAPDRVEVLQAYCRSGHWFTMVGSTVLAQGMTPDAHMPIEVIHYTRIPSRFFGMGMAEPNIDIQSGMSQVLNQILRNARLMSNPKVLIDRNSKVDENAFTSREGEKVLYSGVQPSVWVPPPLPAYVQQLPAMLQSYSHDVTGIHTTSTGKRAVGISSGRAIEALTSNDLAQLQTTQDSIIRAVEGMATTALCYIKAYYPESKVMRAFDQYGKSIFRGVRSTELGDNPEVFIEADSLFSATVKDRDQKTLDLLRLGMIDAKTASKMLSFHLDPMAPLEEIAEMQHAQQVLSEVIIGGYWLVGPDGQQVLNPATGQPKSRVVIYPTDDLEMFERVVKDYMRSDAFRSLDEAKAADVDSLYQEIISMQQAAMPAPEGKPEMNSNGNPKNIGEPGAPRVPQIMPGNMDTMAQADAAVDSAEAGMGAG